MDREQYEKLEKTQLVEIILRMQEELKIYAARIAELESRLNTHSGNSSIPPSKNPLDKRKPKSLRPKSANPPGGQKGHKGSGLKLDREPDKILEHKAEVCANCGTDLTGVECVCSNISNVIDVTIAVTITQHRQMMSECPTCGEINEGNMPNEANHAMVYGAGIRAVVVLLSNYACVSMKKISQILKDIFGVPISTGTIANINASFAKMSQPILEEIKAWLLGVPLIQKDETGMNMNGKQWWLHTASTNDVTYMTAHPKRGAEGIDDNIDLEDYVGIILHDFWASYFRYKKCLHAMCCAHLLRELEWVAENCGHEWASKMIELLLEMKKVKEEYLDAEKFELSRYYVNKFARLYNEIIALGEKEAPHKAKSRKQTKQRNLLVRFIKYKNEITLFAHNFNVPFDNNLSERDIRNAKVKDKVSGAFRSESGLKNFAKISSVLGTAKKQGLSAFGTIKNIIIGAISSLGQMMKLEATE